MLAVMKPWKPTMVVNMTKSNESDMWQLEDLDEDHSGLDSYIV